MAYYKGFDKKGVKYFVEEDTEEIASDSVDNLMSAGNIISKLSTANKHDFTLYDTTYENQFKIVTVEGWTFFGTALNRKDFIHKWNLARVAGTGNFAGKTFYSCVPAPRNKFYLKQSKAINVLNAHFGQGSSDYTVAAIPTVIDKAVRGKFTHIRDNYSTTGTTAMLPVDGPSGRLMQAITAAANAGLDYILTLSITGATGGSSPRLPATLDSAWVTGSTGKSSSWTKAEIDAIYTEYYTKGVNVQTYHPNRNYWLLGSELDNLNVQLKIKAGHGAYPSPTPAYDATKDTFVYSSNSTWDARWFPMAVAAIAGYNNGIKSVNSKAITIVNGSSLHYGLMLRILPDATSQYRANIDWYTTDWYTREETGSDISNRFGSGSIPNKGRAIENIDKLFLKPGIVKGIGMMEYGYKDGDSAFGLGEVDWYNLMRTQYWADPRCICFAAYEAIDSAIDRAGQGFEATLGLSSALVTAMEGWQYFPKPPFVNPYI